MKKTAEYPIPQILFEDPHLLIINKPAGLLSIQDGYDPDLPHVRQVLEPVYGELWMVHRLDKETSGALILGRDAESHRALNRQFQERETKKVYHALVSSIPDWREKVMDQPLKPNADRMHRTRVDLANGKEAYSAFEVKKVFELGTLMEICILTGITHQIRAHLRSENLALFGESLYDAGLPEPPLKAPRMMLHAKVLGCQHPLTGKPLEISAPYPNDFRSFLTDLRFATKRDEEI
jgi:RluA family pseudouridine synthase